MVEWKLVLPILLLIKMGHAGKMYLFEILSSDLDCGDAPCDVLINRGGGEWMDGTNGWIDGGKNGCVGTIVRCSGLSIVERSELKTKTF